MILKAAAVLLFNLIMYLAFGSLVTIRKGEKWSLPITIAVGFFAVAGVVCIQMFLHAHRISENARIKAEAKTEELKNSATKTATTTMSLPFSMHSISERIDDSTPATSKPTWKPSSPNTSFTVSFKGVFATFRV